VGREPGVRGCRQRSSSRGERRVRAAIKRVEADGGTDPEKQQTACQLLVAPGIAVGELGCGGLVC
jgi:hypothetical protein